MNDLVDTKSAVATRRNFQKGVEWIVADQSISMNCYVPNTNKTRLGCLCEVINSYGEHIQTLAFSDGQSLHIGPVELYPKGHTYLGKALAKIQQYEPNYIVVISDGRVNDESRCEAEATKLSQYCIIDCLYIGSDDDYAIGFLSRLASIGNGRFRRYDITKPQTLSLTSVVQGLLPPPEEVIQS